MKKSIFRRSRWFASAVAGVLALWPSFVSADSQVKADPYGSPQELERYLADAQVEVCTSFAPCAVGVEAARTGNRIERFFKRIGDAFTGKGKIDSNDVFEAAEPEYPIPNRAQRLLYDLKKSVSSALASATSDDSQDIEYTVQANGRYTVYSGAMNTVTANGQTSRVPNGAGVAISSDGTMQRGNFSNGALASGQKISSSGTVELGNYSSGNLAGQGFRSASTNGQYETIEGTFENGVPVGEVVRVFADGSRVRELWENGRVVKVGKRVARGQIPPAIETVAPPLPQMASAAQQQVARKEGWHQYVGADGRRRFELWCKNQRIAVGDWAPIGQAPLAGRWDPSYAERCNGPTATRQGGPATTTRQSGLHPCHIEFERLKAVTYFGRTNYSEEQLRLGLPFFQEYWFKFSVKSAKDAAERKYPNSTNITNDLMRDPQLALMFAKGVEEFLLAHGSSLTEVASVNVV